MQGGFYGPMPTGVTLSKSGKLYGVTYAGGVGYGTVFELSSASGGTWIKTILHDFSGPDGANPDATLVFDSSGTLYGTTQDGGTDNNGGTVFAMTPPSAAGGTWTQSVVYSFDGVYNEPHSPHGGVTLGPSGTLFGTTYSNACGQCSGDNPQETGGTVFALIPPSAPGGSWTQDTISNLLTVPNVGYNPVAGVVFDNASLYGTTAFGCGTVFEASPPLASGGSWTSTVIHGFGVSPDGCNPEAPLVVGPGHVLYGTSRFGGAGDDYGTVFQLTPPAAPGGTWGYSVIWNFTGVDGDGAQPEGALLVGEGGVLYGTTSCGGSGATVAYPCRVTSAPGSGVIFSLTPPTTPGGAWSEKILHSFSGGAPDGAAPIAGLTPGPGGVLYGTTSGGLYFTTTSGGDTQSGTVFSIQP